MAAALTARERLKGQLSDPYWRWCNLYWILDRDGNKVKFNLRPAIRHFIENLHTRNNILKARRLGFSTAIDIYILDTIFFTGNLAAVLLAHRETSAIELFSTKVKYPYNHMPLALRRQNPVVTGRTKSIECTASTGLELANGSRFVTDVSGRGGTYQLVHISEYGILSAEMPLKALEVKTGTLAAANSPDSIIFIESTAKGVGGIFHEMCEQASRNPTSPFEYKLHFYGWWQNPDNVANADHYKETQLDAEYFEKVEKSQGISLSPEQRRWYVLERAVLKSYMKSEHPSTPEEAFEGQVHGTYYSEQMHLLKERGQIGKLPFLPGHPVHTAWDLGGTTAVWFWQQIGATPHVIRYYEAQHIGADSWSEILDRFADEHGYKYGQHFAPFDVKTQEGTRVIVGTNILEQYEEAGIFFDVLPLEKSVVEEGIPRVQSLLPLCYFDATNCAVGLSCLRTYHEQVNRAMSNDDRVEYTGKPAHDPESHGADAFRYLSMAIERIRKPHKVKQYSESDMKSFHEMYAGVL